MRRSFHIPCWALSVLALATGRAQRQGAQFHWQIELPLARSEWPSDVALAGWVTRAADPTPIQAAGGMLAGRDR